MEFTLMAIRHDGDDFHTVTFFEGRQYKNAGDLHLTPEGWESLKENIHAKCVDISPFFWEG